MKFLSFERLFGGRRQRRGTLSSRPRETRRFPRRPQVETLEDRTLLAVLPVTNVLSQAPISGGNGSYANPSTAVDPANPQKVVSVYTRFDTSTTTNPYAPQTPVISEVRFSTNGGLSWAALATPFGGGLPQNLLDPTTSNPIVRFSRMSDPSVAFDRFDNFYIVYSEHNQASTAGAIVLQKYSFSGASPSYVALPNQIGIPVYAATQGHVLYAWAPSGMQEPVFNPMIAVDNTLAAPPGGPPNPRAGSIYVGWSTIEVAPTPPPVPPFNPYSIKVMASLDGGANFTTTKYVNANGFSNAPGGGQHARPRLAVSQGGSNRAAPGQLTIVWDDFGRNRLESATLTDGGVGAFPAVAPGTVIGPATGMGTRTYTDTTGTDIAAGTTSTATVNVPDRGVIARVVVRAVNIVFPNMASLTGTLIAPSGTRVELFSGLPIGANMTGTAFDSTITPPNPIRGGTPPFGPGPYTPTSGSAPMGLAVLNNQASFGDWRLEIINNDGTATGQLANWTLEIQYNLVPTVTTVNLPPVDLTNLPVGPSEGLSDINVMLSIVHPNLSALLIELVYTAPDGTMTTATLLRNRINAAGMSDNMVGTAGANLGIAAGSNIPVGTIFDDLAPRSIRENLDGATAPFIGHYRSDPGGLSGLRATFVGRTASQLTGTWTLRITDFQMRTPPPVAQVVNFGVDFTFRMRGLSGETTVLGSPPPARVAGVGPVAGQEILTYPLRSTAAPDFGIGTQASLAADNTQGTLSPYQGRLYLAYTDLAGGQADNTSIFVRSSDNGGALWSGRIQVNDDLAIQDGFSEANPFLSLGPIRGRPKFQPEIAVDQATGTVVVTWYDARYDASRSRVARFVTASIDGGRTWSKQTFLNLPNRAFDEVTRKVVTIGPIPDNISTGNTHAQDKMFGFGDRQGLTVYGGRIFATWAGNINGGDRGTTQLQIWSAIAYIAGGPRVFRSTMGPVQAQTGTRLSDGAFIPFNDQFDVDGTPLVNGFVVYFDRPIDPATLTPDQVTVLYRDVSTTGNSQGIPIPLDSTTPFTALVDETSPLTPGQQLQFGASKYLVKFVPQSGRGTYSYTIGPNIRDRISYRFVEGGGVVPGNFMDQNPGVEQSRFNLRDPNRSRAMIYDTFANPRPLDPFFSFETNSLFFRPAYDQDTLPLIIPGPHVIRTYIQGAPATPDNLVLNGTVSSIDVVFDRDMDPRSLWDGRGTFDPGSFTTDKVIRVMGPSGQIGPNGSIRAFFTVMANPNGSDPNPSSPRTYRIKFHRTDNDLADRNLLRLDLNGTYTVVLASSVRSAAGDALDTNLNAGVDTLRTTPSAGTQSVTFASTAGAQTVRAGQDAVMNINFPDDFEIQGITVRLNITYDRMVSDLQAFLTAPDGTQVNLFSGVGGTSGGGFPDTIFDDARTAPDGTDVRPITQGLAPFGGRWNPQNPLNVLRSSSQGSHRSGGTWRLTIHYRDDVDPLSGRSGTLNSWSVTLLKPISSTGLGELIADQATFSFRLFTTDPANPLSRTTWTSVGPASITGGGTNDHSGRIGGLALDPSDPSGNTVYVGGASGGVWKTTNFLTTDPAGPKYIPLTDFGPTRSLNIGGIAVFGRNNDPNQSIIFAATGEGDDRSPGVGFLRSMDGGATWTLLDSTVNFDGNGRPLPINSSLRDHVFVGMTSFKVIVDPRLSPANQVLVYAAISGTNGGIWRSRDTGKTWERMSANIPGTNTDPTDIVFDPNSGRINTLSNPTGNLDGIYAGFRGNGVYFSPNRGQTWTQLLGTLPNNSLIVNGDVAGRPPIPVTAPSDTPSGAKGRIVLAKPELTGTYLVDGSGQVAYTGNPVQDLLYQGWLYALVIGPGNTVTGLFNGLYLTKDFGEHWTKVRIPTAGRLIPTNDAANRDIDPFGAPPFAAGQGNYDVSVAVDPTNPNIVYIGGTFDGPPMAFTRVDTTFVTDPHAFFLGNDKNDNGALRINTADPVRLQNWPPPSTACPATLFMNPVQSCLLPPFEIQYPVLNLIRDPNDPFGGDSQIVVSRTAQFANAGTGASWIPFDDQFTGNGLMETDHHRIFTFRDPLTGHARLVVGNDQGVFTTVDNNGTFTSGIGTAIAPLGSRNGNLQITQFYYGTSQPSLETPLSAAQRAGALFYGQAQDDGFPRSDPNILSNGNLQWTGTPGDGTGIATDQLGSGTLYQYNWPCCGGDGRNFFQVNGTGRTFGLFNPNDTQWGFPQGLGGFNFAVNSVDAAGIVMVSGDGRAYRTTDQAQHWSIIGEPSALDGSPAPAVAFGAPPIGAADQDAINSVIYLGTDRGNIFVTFTGGGGAPGGLWKNLSAGATHNGLDGSGVRWIVTNPTRGSHEVYAVTFRGVYYMQDSAAPSSDAAGQWQNITSNLFQITHNVFTPFLEPTQLVDTRLRSLETIAADWRYPIPDDPNELRNPRTPPITPGPGTTHPVLYVAGEGGVYRSFDKGRTWSPFPNLTEDGPAGNFGAQQNGGFLGNMHITDIRLALGNVNQTSGRATLIAPNGAKGGDILLASTFGRGSFAIRIAPMIVSGSVRLDPTVIGQDSLPSDSQKILQPVIDGMTEQTAFGNQVKIELFERLADGTLVNVGVDPINQSQAFTFTDSNGRFKIRVKAGQLNGDGTSDGVHRYFVRATDDIGEIGPLAGIDYNLSTTPFIRDTVKLDPNHPTTPGGSDSGLSFTDGITKVTDLFFVGRVDQAIPVPIQAFDVTDPFHPILVATGQTTAQLDSLQNNFSIEVFPGIYKSDGSTDGTHRIRFVSPRQPPLASSNDAFLSFTLRTTPPATPAAPDLLPESNTGPADQRRTRIKTPTFFGTGEPRAKVFLYANNDQQHPIGTDFVNAAGNFTVTVAAPLNDGTYDITVQLEEVAGNFSGISAPMRPQLIIQSAGPSQPTLVLNAAYQMPPGSSCPQLAPTQCYTAATTPQVFDGTADPGTNVVIKDNGVPVDSFRQGNTPNFTRTLSLSEGVHPLRVESSDAAGNTSVSNLVLVTINRDTLDKDRKFIRQIYFNALGRLGSLPEWNFWLPALALPQGRLLVANAIERSLEGRDRLVKTWYQTYLGRAANGTEELGWASAMAVNGLTEETVLAAILSSQEYFNRAAALLGQPPSDAAFLTRLYQQILGRTPAQSEIDFWVGILGQVSRFPVAYAFLNSPEFRTNTVTSFYTDLLRRTAPPAPQEVAGWVNSSADLALIRIAFESSVEYYFRATGFFP